jgi:hypothetical protein
MQLWGRREKSVKVFFEKKFERKATQRHKNVIRIKNVDSQSHAQVQTRRCSLLEKLCVLGTSCSIFLVTLHSNSSLLFTNSPVLGQRQKYYVLTNALWNTTKQDFLYSLHSDPDPPATANLRNAYEKDLCSHATTGSRQPVAPQSPLASTFTESTPYPGMTAVAHSLASSLASSGPVSSGISYREMQVSPPQDAPLAFSRLASLHRTPSTAPSSLDSPLARSMPVSSVSSVATLPKTTHGGVLAKIASGICAAQLSPLSGEQKDKDDINSNHPSADKLQPKISFALAKAKPPMVDFHYKSSIIDCLIIHVTLLFLCAFVRRIERVNSMDANLLQHWRKIPDQQVCISFLFDRFYVLTKIWLIAAPFASSASSRVGGRLQLLSSSIQPRNQGMKPRLSNFQVVSPHFCSLFCLQGLAVVTGKRGLKFTTKAFADWETSATHASW